MTVTRNLDEEKTHINCIPRHLDVSKVQTNGRVLTDAQREEIFSQPPPSQSSLRLAKDPDHYHTIWLMQSMQSTLYVIAEQIFRHPKSNMGVLLLTPEPKDEVPKDNVTFKIVKEFQKYKEAEVEYKALLKYKGTGVTLLEEKENKKQCALVISDYEPGYTLHDLMYKRNKPNTLESSWPDLQWLRLSIQVIEAGIKLEDKDILQCDFSLSNFIYNVLTQKLSAIDFANTLAVEKKTDQDQVTTKVFWYTGTYFAPEIAAQDLQHSQLYSYTLKAPTFILGIIAQEIALNQHFYWDNDCCKACNFFFFNTKPCRTCSKSPSILR